MNSRRTLLALLGVVVLALPVPGSAQYFGRNKVQYRSFDFEIIRTEHFDVHYYKQEREAAMDAARVAERSYARLTRILQSQFRERKALILYASHTDFQRTNVSYGMIDESTGAFAEPIKNRLVVPFTGSYADFDHVFTHELVHAFQFEAIYRRGAASENNRTARLPLWFLEGMAEYLSIGHIDALTSGWLRDATLSGYLRDIAAMSVRDDYLSYRFGQSLWHYIGSKWGDEAIGILLAKAPRMGLERAFSTTLGVSLAELNTEWTASVRKTYLPQVAEHAAPSAISEKLTRHNKLGDPWFLSPAISPDGTRMVYLSQEDGFFFDLWLADAQTGQPLHKLISSARDANFESLRYMTSSASFSADGRYVTFSAQTGGRDALYIYDLRKKRVAKKLKFELDGIESPSFSPDGQRIVFSGNSGGLSDLYIADVNGKKLTRLTADRHADLVPSWSPDGKTIAFSTDRGPGTNFDRMTYGNMRVALYRVDTQELTVLPEQESGKHLNPVWAPDSRSLVWVNDADGTNNLHLFDLNEQKLYRISDLLSGVIAVKDISPVLSWSSRSGRLLYTYFEKAGYNIYAVNDPRQLPRLPLRTAKQPVVAQTAPAVMGSNGGGSNGNGNNGSNASAGSSVAPGTGQADASATNGSGRTTLQNPTTSIYRDAQGFRPSNQPAPDAPKAVSVTALLDSATMALPDTTAFKHRDYKVKFSPDMVGQPSVGATVGGYNSGLAGGSFIALSDLLGNHNILLSGSVNGSLADGTFFGAYSFLKKRANFGFVLEQVPLYRYYGSDYMSLDVNGQPQNVAASVFVRDVIRTAAGYLSYPFSQFKRLELGASGVLYQTDLVYFGHYLDTGDVLNHAERVDNLSFVQPMAALVFDNTLFGWTGPIYGRRYRAQFSRAFGNFEFTEGLLDFRNYWNYKRKVVLAARAIGLTRFGADARRFSAFWGGPYYLRGYDAKSFDLQSSACNLSNLSDQSSSFAVCPVRDQLIGSSVAFVNTELRFPLIKELQLGFLGAFPPVDFVTFFDGGLAWDSEICLQSNLLNPRRCAEGSTQKVDLVWRRKEGDDPVFVRQPLFAYGIGLRMNIFYTVLRMDYAVPLSRPDRSGFRNGIFSISFGPSF